MNQINAAVLLGVSKFHAHVMLRMRMLRKRQKIMKLLFVIASVVFNIVSNNRQ